MKQTSIKTHAGAGQLAQGESDQSADRSARWFCGQFLRGQLGIRAGHTMICDDHERRLRALVCARFCITLEGEGAFSAQLPNPALRGTSVPIGDRTLGRHTGIQLEANT